MFKINYKVTQDMFARPLEVGSMEVKAQDKRVAKNMVKMDLAKKYRKIPRVEIKIMGEKPEKFQNSQNF